MTTLTTLVDRGLQLHRRIEADKLALRDITAQLEAAALAGDQHPLADPDREGRQYLATGTAETVPIILTADLLAQTFADGSMTHLRAEAVAAADLPRLYRPVTTWKMLPKSGKAFRSEAAELLGPAKAAELITAVTARDKDGIPKSQIRIEWDRATPNT